MFKIIMNNNIMAECRTYKQALNKAQKIKDLYCQKFYEVLIESPNGLIMDRLK